MCTVSTRLLNRWTLHRQFLLRRQALDCVEAIRRLGPLQAQYSPSPYIALWSRLVDFDRRDLERALQDDCIYRATLLRGTLHLVAADQFDAYRLVSRNVAGIYSDMARRMRAAGIDVDAVREVILREVASRPLSRKEITRLAAALVPEDLPQWAGFAAVQQSGDLINLPEDGRFTAFAGSHYRPAPPVGTTDADAFRAVARWYLMAYGPATRGDLAKWSGQRVRAFDGELAGLPLISIRTEDGREMIDLADAERPDKDVTVPIRFLPKWDNLLLAYERRDRILPSAYQPMVILRNGDVLPTFLVDGMVAGVWEAPIRGPASLTLRAFGPLSQPGKSEVEEEAARLLDWLRPDTDARAIRWVDA